MANLFNVILVHPLLNVLIFIYAVLPGHDFGLTVIILTIIIRGLLWPIVGRQLHSQKKLQALQPEIAKIKKKAAGDKQAENKMLMELYREKEINPFSSCLPLIIQLPFLLALFVVFRQGTGSFSALASHLYLPIKNLAYVKDLTLHAANFKPTFLGLVSMAKPNLILALLAGISQYWQAKMLTPANIDKKDPQTQVASTMTLLFPALTALIALRLPAALAVYWTTTTLVAILQQFLIARGETEKMEEGVSIKKLTPAKKKNE